MDTPTFEHQALEADLQTLAAEIRRNHGEQEMKDQQGVEVVREAIRSFPQLNNQQGVPVPTPPPAATSANGPLPAYAANAPAEVKLEIEYLMDLALHHGITKALSASEKSPYFVQDAFHDALAGKLYPELQKRGLIK